MYKIVRVVLTVFLAGLFLNTGSVNAEWIPLNQGTTADFSILKAGEEETLLEIKPSGLEVKQKEINGQSFQVISIPNAGFTDQIGLPQMPVLGTLIGVNQGADISLKVVESEYLVLEGYRVWPFQAETDHSDQDLVINSTFYQSNQEFPGTLAEVSEPKVWRDLDLVELKIFPVQYNATTSELKVYTKIVVKLTQTGGQVRSQIIPYRYEKMYQALVLNYQYLYYQTEDVPGKYLIIAADTFLTEIQPLVEWYYRKGYSAELTPVSEIGVTPEEIKDYVLSKYENEGLDWLLLVGNLDQIPWYVYTGGGYSDSYYSFLQGNDFYPEIAVGRLSIRGNVSLTNQIQKILNYQKNPLTGDWLIKSVLVAHGENYPDKYSLCKRQIFEYEYSFFTPEMDTLMGGAGATNVDVTNAINQGRNIVNYRGHGYKYGWPNWNYDGDVGESWTNDNVRALTNGAKTPIVYNIACSCHILMSPDDICLGEVWLAQENGGAAASLGATRLSYTDPNHDYDKALYWAPYDDQIFEIGWISNYAAAYILPLWGNCAPWNVKVYLWLGDPAMEIWTSIPDSNGLTVEHPSIIDPGEEFLVQVRDGGRPVPGALVCLVKGEEVYQVGYTTAAGQIIFTPEFEPGDSLAYLTVTKHDYLPYEAVIDTYVGIDKESPAHPEEFTLSQNLPNPFNSLTEIKYTLPNKGLVNLAVYDVMGRLVKTLVNKEQDAGAHSIYWKAENLSTGIYFYRLILGRRALTKKMLLVK